MRPVVYYCYDAYCGWCYGFSPVITKLAEEYSGEADFEVLSGGMIMEENPRHISAIAAYVQQAYRQVEEMTGVQFGRDYLWHIFNPDKSDWHPHSLLPAVALCIFREYLPHQAVELAAEIQYALNFEGRDLTDKEAYRHMVAAHSIPEEEFFSRLGSREYIEKAYDDFAMVRQLQVKGFPSVLLQMSASKFHMLAYGYTPYDILKERMENIFSELK